MQERKLEEDHAEIEFRIRKLMNKPGDLLIVLLVLKLKIYFK